MAKKDRIYFHVVNSVKGGSGKSTFSLLLADRITCRGELAYIIDLDVCGTSWYGDYKHFFVGENHKFINKLMYVPYNSSYPYNIWSKLKTTDTNKKARLLNVCMAGSDPDESIYDKMETELLEDTTLRIIKDAINQSAEQYSDVNALLCRISNELYRKCRFLEDIEFQIIMLNELLDRIDDLSDKWFVDELSNIRDKISSDTSVFYSLNNYVRKVESMFSYLIEELYQSNAALTDSSIMKVEMEIELLFDEFDETIRSFINIKKINNRDTNDDNNQQKKSYKYRSEKRFQDHFDSTLSNACAEILKYLERYNSDESEITLVESIKKMIYDIKKGKEKSRLKAIASNTLKERASYWCNKSKYYEKNNIHIIFDLPPNYENSIEEICQHLLFDQSSKLFGSGGADCYINFYMMTPIDQPSAKDKNIQYARDILCGKRNYSSNITEFVRDNRVKFFFIVNDNHSYIEHTHSNYSIIYNKEIWVPEYDNIYIGFLPFAHLKYKNYVNIFSIGNEDKRELDVSGYSISNFESIIEQAIKIV